MMKKSVSILLTILICLMCIGSIFACFAYSYLNNISENSKQIDLDMSKIKGGIATLYYYDFTDRENRKGYPKKLNEEIHGGGYKQQYIEYDKIPSNLIDAFVSIEDKHFFEHNGVDFPRTIYAATNYIFKGKQKFGASTITQQLIKNLTGNDDITISRKMNEIFTAINLEKKLDKTEILTLYLNIINLSDGCYGVGAACEHYFSKDISEITISEAATLAAIINNPTFYNPRINPENAQARRDLVLQCMYEQGFIDSSEYEKAISDPINLNIKNKDSNGVNSFYVDAVISDVIVGLCKKYNINRDAASLMIYNSGLRIYIAQDPEIQKIVDTYYASANNFPRGIHDEQPQSAMVIIDPHTGDVLALAGSIGKKSGNRIQNLATDALISPGSSIKPLSVYAPAFEHGIVKWSTEIDDTPLENGWPANANKKYVGKTDIAYAIKNSLNTVPVRLLHQLGNKKSFDFLKQQLNIQSLTESDMGDAALALGQPTYGITLLELTSAYSIFQDGSYCKPRLYFKVTDSNGNIILDNESEERTVISKENAVIMTKLLESVIEEGTARGSISLNSYVEVAGKTGTTQNNCDKIFVGYTPTLLAGVWFGYEYPKPLDGIRGNSSAYIWNKVMTDVYSSIPKYSEKLAFDVPDNVKKLSYENSDGGFSYGWFQTD